MKLVNIFKKRYKKSEWFEGLLWAETTLYKYGKYSTCEMFVQDVDGMEEYEILWRNHPHEKPWVVKTVSREFGRGIMDYLNYFEEYLK